jgi:hypothetical protein
MDWEQIMFEDIQPLAQLERDFTKLELSVIIEALILFRSSRVRPDFDSIDPDTVTLETLDEIDIPVKTMTEEDEEAINEMTMLFMAGFAQIISIEHELLEEAYDKGANALVSEISDFLKEQ